jgi:TetR/AcrR family transcriptional repressor of bet genes
MKKRAQSKAYKKSEASRQQVLDAAVVTLAERGFAQTSVQDIADAAKLSKGAVHYHFESKDDLIQCVLSQCCEHLSARAKAAWEAPGSPTERVRRAVEEMWSARKERTPEFKVISDLMAQAVHDESLRAPVAQMFQRNREQLVEAGLRGLLALGIKPKVSEAVIPRLLLAALDGLALHAVFDPMEPAEEAETLRALEMISVSLFDVPAGAGDMAINSEAIAAT